MMLRLSRFLDIGYGGAEDTRGPPNINDGSDQETYGIADPLMFVAGGVEWM